MTSAISLTNVQSVPPASPLTREWDGWDVWDSNFDLASCPSIPPHKVTDQEARR